jgi:phosphatidylethanolamine/phosphatidyl-N-methylethanolamine N-methyltransferase
MDLQTVQAAYRRYARIYDLIFGPVMEPGRRRVVQSLKCRSGEKVLEVGVGTGLSLPLYPDEVQVTGIDVSSEMLEKARHRVQRHNLGNVADLLEMDAENMSFADSSFDKVVAMYVVTVVPDPFRLVDEMRRVCKPDGEIVIVNHFQSKVTLVSFFEKLLSRFSGAAGFRPDLDLDDFVATSGLKVLERTGTNVFGYWTMLRCQNDSDSAQVLPFVPQVAASDGG